jgi:hypothetical protein
VSSESRPVTISSEQTQSRAQSSQPAVTVSSTEESPTVEFPVACPVIDLAAGDSSDPGPEVVESSSSSDDEADAELANARHEAAQARVRLLEARVRERLARRSSRSNSSGSGPSRPSTPHEPVLPVTVGEPVTPPRSTWRRGRPLLGLMPPPSPVPEVPAAYRPRDPALHALRESERREIQLELAQLRAEREQLAARREELDARAAAIDREVENRVVAASANNSTVFGTPDVPSAPPGLVMHFMSDGQHPEQEFRTPEGPNEVSLTPALEGIPTPIATPRQTKQANLQVARGGDPDPDPSESSSADDNDERRRKPISVRNDARELAPYKVKSTELRLGAWPNTIQFAGWRRALRASVAGASDRPELATAWIFEVESPDATFEMFRQNPSDRLRTLDAKLAEALGRVIKGETARRVAIASERAALDGTLLTGRQILYMVYQDYRRDEAKTDHVAYGNLEKLGSVSQDGALEGFMSTWEALLLTFKTPPTEAHLYSAFYARLCKVPGLSVTVAHIDRQAYGHEDKSYDFLYSAASRLVQQRREERQAGELAKLYAQPSGQVAMPAAPTTDKKTLPCFKLRDGHRCEAGDSCPYSHDKRILEAAKTARKGNGKGKGKNAGKSGGKGKGKSKGICRFYNSDKGCHRGSACTFLHETPAMPAKTSETSAPTSKRS